MTDEVITKRDLVERGVEAFGDNIPGASIPVATVGQGGGVSRVDIGQIIDLAKIMASSQDAVPAHCRGNVGVCVRLCFQSVEWGMSPFSVADQSYLVPQKGGGNRLAYMSQILHAVVEARAPLQHRLECEYHGEGEQRVCIVRGYFTSGDVREYETPPIGQITVKNSPLWVSDPDQQLFYFASRSWARKWVPDILLGTYTREELLAQPDLGREYPEVEAPGLHARLKGTDRPDEGHRKGHVADELAQIADAGQTIEAEARDVTGESVSRETSKTPAKAKKSTSEPPAKKATQTKGKQKAKETAKKPDKPATPPPDTDKPTKLPKTLKQYTEYAKAWIAACTDSDELFNRWRDEKKLRNDIGITADEREPLDAMVAARRTALESE